MRPPHAPVVKRSAPCIAPARKPPSGRAFSCARRPVAAVGSSVLPTQHGGSWPLGSCAPSPTAPTAPGWCLLLSHPPEHAHTYTRGLWAPQVLCFLSLLALCSCAAVPCAPLAGACRAPLCSPHVVHASCVLHGHCTGCVRVPGPAACAVRPRRHITGRSGLIGESPPQQV
jgi:hypothetical protein